MAWRKQIQNESNKQNLQSKLRLWFTWGETFCVVFFLPSSKTTSLVNRKICFCIFSKKCFFQMKTPSSGEIWSGKIGFWHKIFQLNYKSDVFRSRYWQSQIQFFFLLTEVPNFRNGSASKKHENTIKDNQEKSSHINRSFM